MNVLRIVSIGLLAGLLAGLGGCGSIPPLGPNMQIERIEREYVQRADGPLHLTIYRPVGNGAGVAARPMFLWLHGGAFVAGHRRELEGYAAALARLGYVAATVEYRLAPRHRYPAAVRDAYAAVRYLRANAAELGGDPERLGVGGVSAGTALALMVAYCDEPERHFGSDDPAESCGDARVSPRVQAAVNLYGPVELGREIERARTWARLAVEAYMGGSAADVPERWRQASPLPYVGPDAPPTLTIHGVNDRTVSFEQAERLDAALRANGVRHVLIPVDGRHGFGYRFGTRDSYAILPAVGVFLAREME